MCIQLLRIDVTSFFFGSLYWKRLHITQQKRRKKNQRKDILQGIEFIQDATRSESSGKTMEMRCNERRIHTRVFKFLSKSVGKKCLWSDHFLSPYLHRNSTMFETLNTLMYTNKQETATKHEWEDGEK